MEQPKPLEGAPPAVARPDRPLGRGLADVARVFLTQENEAPAPDLGSGPRMVRPLPGAPSAPSALLLRPAAQVTRQQVAAALTEFAGALEDGLRVLDADLPCGPWGTIDLLAADRASQLAVVDFDTASGDELLLRGLAHLDWIAGNVPNLRRMFRGQAINFSLQPRLFLLAPQFSSRVSRVARLLPAVPVVCIRYHWVETPGRPGILFEPLPAAEI